MKYINQIGQCECGRGDTLSEAVEDAKKWGFDISESDVREWRPGWPCTDGDLVIVDEPQLGYQRLDEVEKFGAL